MFGGALGEVYGEKIVKVMDVAMKIGCPVIGINDGGGARIQEGVVALGLYGEIFRRNSHASGVIPQISLVMGPAAGGAVYSPALTDFTVMVDETSFMFITGPDVIKTVTGEDVEFEALGGARTHNTTSGNAHYLASDEDDAIAYVQELLGYLPSNNLVRAAAAAGRRGDRPGRGRPHRRRPRARRAGPRLAEPALRHPRGDPAASSTTRSSSRSRSCTRRTSSSATAASRAARSGSSPTSPPSSPAASTSGPARRPPASCAPATRSTCRSLTFVDVPGFLPGTDQEYNGIIRRGAKLIYAYAEATVPLITVICRKAYGGAYDVMGSKHLGADLNLAWPTAQIAVIGRPGAVSILYRKELKKAEDDGGDVEARRAELQQEYEDTLANPYVAAERGYVDAVIPPSYTRGYVARALRSFGNKRETLPPKKHGNIPL